jgi:chorismate mutase
LFRRLRGLLSAGLVAMATAATVAFVPAAGAETADSGGLSLFELTDVSAERVLVGDLVAAAKFGTSAPIDDPPREQVVLDNVRAQSIQLGIDPEVSVAIFRDQIEANKQVQRGLYALWTAHPELAPKERPDLVRDVRPVLDRITTELLAEIKATQRARTHPTCPGHLIATEHIVYHTRDLDRLHRKALNRALFSVCQDS